MYQTTPIWISGTVTRFELRNPHTITTLEARSADGQVRLWAVEGPPQTAVDRRSGRGAYVPSVGDTLQVCAFPYKPAQELAREGRLSPSLDVSTRQRLESTTTEGASPRLVAGHVLVMPDDTKRSWEPHGVLAECVRSSGDDIEPWLDFLDAEAHDTWCEQRRYATIRSNAPLSDFVEEINGRLEKPCP
jgi:hypothetical protein